MECAGVHLPALVGELMPPLRMEGQGKAVKVVSWVDAAMPVVYGAVTDPVAVSDVQVPSPNGTPWK